MPIVLRHQAAGIAPDQENPRTKYGMAMVLQQQRSDQQMRQRTQDQQYDMQRMGAMGAMREMREPSRAERREMLDMQIQNGAVPQGLIKPLRDLAAEEARVMRNRSLNAEQMGEALSQIDSQMSIIMSSAYPQRMAANRMQQAQANQQPAGPPSAREAFRKDRKLFGEYTARAQATFEGAETPPTSQMILDKAGELFDAEQAWLNASPAAAPTQGQPASQPPNAPAAAPAGQPQASYSGGQPTFGGSPVMAQGGMGAPVGPGAYQPGGYTSPEVFGAANVLANPANQQYAEVSGGNRDTQYSLQNPQMSAGLAYFDPNNTVRQEMSAADQSMVNPQKQTLGKPGGRYGLGQIDYGINPATGNRVTASIRPGGTMPEYDEPVGPPGTAMGGGRGGLTIMGGKKKPATAATAEVSPGGTPVNAGLAAAAPMRISRDDPRVKQAEMIAVNPNASEDEQNRAADILKNAGYKEQDVARLAASGSATQSSKKRLRDPFWGPVGEFLADPLGEYNPLVGSKQNANVVASRSASAPSRGQMLNASPSLLDQLEQAEPASANPVVPSPAGGVTQDRGELRTWTSVDGRTFEGSIVEGSLDPTAKTISVKRKDGQVFSNVPIDRFGEEDRAYIDALYKVGNATNWTEKPDSRMGKGEAYQYDKPAGSQDKKPTPKSKYIGETPKEVYQRPPSSSRSTAKRTG